MSIFDDYTDPNQFEAGGGLLGRLISLQRQQAQYQPAQGFEPISSASAGDTPDYGQTQDIRIGDYRMPQFGRAESPQVVPVPDLGGRLSAGFQSWAHTPVGNPFAALANGITGFSLGQPVGQTVPQDVPSRSIPMQTVAGGIPPHPNILPSRRRSNNGR